MNIPFLHSATKANEKLAEMATQLTEAKALVVDVTKEKDAATAALAAVRATLAERDTAAEACRAQFDATLAAPTEKLSAANTQTATLTASAQTAGQLAAAAIAAQGLPPSALPSVGASDAAPTAAVLGAQIRAEADPAKRAALFAQLQLVWNSKN